MNVRDWILGEHAITESMIDGLKASIEHWTARPPGMNPIAYSLWHMTRCEDVLVNGIVRERDQLYVSGWDERVGLPSTEVGLDFVSDEVDALALSVDVEALYGYWRAVREDINAWIAELDDEELDRVPDFDARLAVLPSFLRGVGASAHVPDLFRGRPVGFYLQWETVFHANLHVGEMHEIRSALGRI